MKTHTLFLTICLNAVLIFFLASSFAQSVGVSQSNFSPQSLFHIHNTSAGQLFQLTNLNTTGGNTPTASSGFNIGIDASMNITFNQFENASMQFLTNDLARMIILSGGNVGIGTAIPSSLFSVGNSSQFQINGSGNIVALNGITISWPSAQGAAKTYLQNDGTGNLSWKSPKIAMQMINQSSIAGVAKNITVYSNSNTWGYLVESYSQTPMPACVVTDMKINIYSPNGITGNTVFTLMQNGVATSMSISVGSSATGWFSTTGSVTFAQGDLIDVRISTANSGSGSIYPLSITIFYQP